MRKLTFTLVLATICLCLGACDDDDPVKPETFSVQIRVVDTVGKPVEGLRVGLVNDTPYYYDNLAATKAATGIRFIVPQECRVRLAIRDVEGGEIRLLVDDKLAAGTHMVVWNGLDYDEVHQPSGRYSVHMAAYELGSNVLLFEDTTDMYMALLDSSRVPTGYTDADGRLVLKDKKVFPHLYDLPEMTARDENGDIMGKLDLTPLMRISLVDENGGGGMGFEEEIVAGTVLELVWEPIKVPDAAVAGEKSGTVASDIIAPVVEFELLPVFPNPFN